MAAVPLSALSRDISGTEDVSVVEDSDLREDGIVCVFLVVNIKMRPLLAAGYVVVGIVLLSFLSRAAGSGHFSMNDQHKLRHMLSAANQTCASAAQDRNPMLAAMHALQGKSMAEAARSLAGDDYIRRKCGIEVGELIQSCSAQQRRAIRRVQKVAPKIALRTDIMI